MYFCNVDAVTPIVVKGGAEVPDVYSVGGPGATEGGSFMHQYHGFRGSHRGGIGFVDSVEEGVGGNFGVEARVAE